MRGGATGSERLVGIARDGGCHNKLWPEQRNHGSTEKSLKYWDSFESFNFNLCHDDFQIEVFRYFSFFFKA